MTSKSVRKERGQGSARSTEGEEHPREGDDVEACRVDGRRIVACVNYLVGVPTEKLERRVSQGSPANPPLPGPSPLEEALNRLIVAIDAYTPWQQWTEELVEAFNAARALDTLSALNAKEPC